MDWTCPECGGVNHEDMNRCYCGHSIDRVEREVKKEPELSSSMNRRETIRGVTMIGTSLYRRKQRVMMYLWLYGAMTGAGLLLLLVTAMNDKEPRHAIGLMAMGIVFFIVTKTRSSKPTVIVKDDHIEIDQGRLHLIRYRDIWKVEKPEGKRVLKMTAQNNGGGTKTINILLSELEDAQGAQLAVFLKSKATAQ